MYLYIYINKRVSCSPSWELELRPLGVATGNALSVTRSEDTYEKNTTCWPATAHDVTTGVPQYKCRREDTSSAFSSSLTGLFEACRVNLVRVQFSNSTMASTSKAFRKCVDPCPRYLTPDDTHDCCVFCLGMEHATRCPWGGGLRALWAALYEEAQLSPVPLFEERGAAVCFPRFKTHRCRGTEANEIVGFAVGGGW